MDTTIFLFTRVASTEGYIVASALITLFLLLRKEYRHARVFVLCSAGLAVSTVLIKGLIGASRPLGGLVEVTGYGFPSGHAAGALFLALCIATLVYTHLSSAFLRGMVYGITLGTALMIGISRVYFGVHTPLQVVAGFALALVWGLLFFWYYRKEHAKWL